MVWTNAVGASASGNSLTKTAAADWGNAGAASMNVIQDGYGYVEFTVPNTSQAAMCGLSFGDSNQNWQDIDFALYAQDGGALFVFEAGTARGQFGTYAAGDRLRVEVAHSKITYRKGDTILYTSTIAPRLPLRVDASLYHTGAALDNVRVGGIAWMSETGITVSESSLTKTNGAGWMAGAVSANEIVSGDGFMEFTATETNTSRIAGLSTGDSGTSSADVDFGIHLAADGTLEVLEGGVSSGSLGSYDSGDRLRVELQGGVVRYYKAGSLLFTSSNSPTYPVRVDTALETPAATLTDVVLSLLVWASLVGVSASGNSVRKTAADGSNAGAISTNEIASGDGFAEFVAVETDKRRTFGLDGGAASQSYADIDFGIDLSAGGLVEVFENGVSKGQFGSFAHGDRFRVEIQLGTVRYRKNQTVFHSSSSTPQYPLHAAAALYTSGATLANVSVGELVWTNDVGVQPIAGGLMRTSSGAAWNAGAASSTAVNTGYFEFTAGDQESYGMAGLGQGDSSPSYDDIDFGILLRADNSLAVYEAGTHRGDFGSYVPGDRFRVAVESGTVTYARNGSVFYTSAVTPVLPLRADTSFYEAASSLLNAVLSGDAVMDEANAPAFSPAGGTYSSPQTVSITSGTSGAVIRFTTDGSEPTTGSTLYDAPVTVDVSQTVKAKAWATGYSPSNVTTAIYSLAIPAPDLSPGAGTYPPPLTVTISSSVGGAEIHYTLNGVDPTQTDPTIASGGTVVLESSGTVKAKAWKTGWTTSAVAAATYTLKVATPTLNPGGGSYTSAQSVTVTTSTPGATIHYTTSGAEPTEADPTVASGSSVQVVKSGTLKAAAWRAGTTGSDTAAGTYWLSLGTVDTPGLTPAPGTYTSAQTVTATGPSGATIRYTTDGSEPTFSSPLYTAPLAIGTTTQLKVKAFKADMTPSAVATGLYVIDVGTVDAPRLTPGGGSYAAAQDVAILSQTPGATIRYTTNGLEPAETDPVLQAGQTVRVDQDLMLRARAWKTGVPVSAVMSASYTLTGAIAAGSNHSLALKSDGTLWTWGWNSFLQLGDPTVPVNAERLTPAQVPGLTDVIAIAAGANHNLALKRDRTVWAWGSNGTLQLGNGGGSSATPTQVAGLTDVIALAAGEGHSLALKNDGTLWEWGSDGHTSYGSTPVQVAGIYGISNIAAGFRHSLALKTDGIGAGTAWAWGTNSWGDLGDGTLNSHAQPAQVALPLDVTAIAGGYTHSLAVRNNDTVWAWGSNGFGALGDGTNTMRLAPVQTSGISGVRSISGGIGFSLALKADASLWTWGDSYYGTLGNGDPNYSLVPLKNVVFAGIAISANGTGTHALGLRADGSIWVWGNNVHGQLGDGTTNTRAFPVPIPNFSLRQTDLTSLDTDGDGLSNVAEVAEGTDPTNVDTNGDGIPDAAALAAGKSATNMDMDEDGVSNADERTRGTDQFRTDTDGDGVLDAPDCFPLDPTRSQCPASDPNDHTPPAITLQEPTNTTLISSQPPP